MCAAVLPWSHSFDVLTIYENVHIGLLTSLSTWLSFCPYFFPLLCFDGGRLNKIPIQHQISALHPPSPLELQFLECLVVIILDAVSMLLWTCKWLHCTDRTDRAPKLFRLSVSHMGRNNDRKFPFAAAPGWNDKGMKKCKPEVQPFIIPHHSLHSRLLYSYTKFHSSHWNQSTLISSTVLHRERLKHILSKFYIVTHGLFTLFLQTLRFALSKISFFFQCWVVTDHLFRKRVQYNT